MEKLPVSRSVEWRNCTRFLVSSLAVYGLLNGKLDLADSDDFLVFYDRSFLHARKWSVVPLWEGDLRVLLMEHNQEFEFTEAIREYCLKRGVNSLYRATVERSKAPYGIVNQKEYVTDDMTITIATHKLDLETTSPAELFEVTDTWIPYWGHNFLWPSDEKFLLYTNGDNAAFIAGDRQEIENILGVNYEYCINRFMTANISHPSWNKFVEPYKKFCQEFV